MHVPVNTCQCVWVYVLYVLTTWKKTTVWRMKLKRLAWSALLLISFDWKSAQTTRGPSVALYSSLFLIVLHAATEIELIFCKLDLRITQCDSNKCLAENGFQSHLKWKLLQGKRAFLCPRSSSSPSWLCVWVYMGWIWIHFLGNWIDTVMHEGSATLLQRADGLSDWIGWGAGAAWVCVCVYVYACVCIRGCQQAVIR